MPFENKQLEPLMTSKKQTYETPKALFKLLGDYFHFDLDVCATADNAKCVQFFSPEDDGLKQGWFGHCWMNPVYQEPEMPCNNPAKCTKKRCDERGWHARMRIPGQIDWVGKASREATEHSGGADMVMGLLPCRPDTEIFTTISKHASLICFLKGRITFEGEDHPAPFPSQLVIFSKEESPDEDFEFMSQFGTVINPRNGGLHLYQP